MLTGDAGDNVPTDWNQYLPEGFGGGDIVVWNEMKGGEELVALPDRLQAALPQNGFAFLSDFDALLSFGRLADQSITNTVFGYSTVDNDDGSKYVTLNKFDYTITVDDGSSPTDDYHESLDVTRSSWVVKLTDLVLADLFATSGDRSGFGSYLMTSTATWDWDFEADYGTDSFLDLTVTLDYDGTFNFDWHESLSYERLSELGILPDDSSGFGSVVEHSGTLDITGNSTASSNGELTVNQTPSGFDYQVGGNTASVSASPGMQVETIDTESTATSTTKTVKGRGDDPTDTTNPNRHGYLHVETMSVSPVEGPSTTIFMVNKGMIVAPLVQTSLLSDDKRCHP